MVKPEYIDGLKKTKSVLEWTIKAASDNEKKYLDSTKDDIKKAVEKARTVVELIKRLLEEGEKPESTIIKDIQRFNNEIKILVNLINNDLNQNVEKIRQLREAAEASDEEARRLQEIVGNTVLVIKAILTTAEKAQQHCDAVLQKKAEFKQLPAEIQETFKKDFSAFVQMHNIVPEVFIKIHTLFSDKQFKKETVERMEKLLNHIIGTEQAAIEMLPGDNSFLAGLFKTARDVLERLKQLKKILEEEEGKEKHTIEELRKAVDELFKEYTDLIGDLQAVYTLFKGEQRLERVVVNMQQDIQVSLNKIMKIAQEVEEKKITSEQAEPQIRELLNKILAEADFEKKINPRDRALIRRFVAKERDVNQLLEKIKRTTKSLFEFINAHRRDLPSELHSAVIALSTWEHELEEIERENRQFEDIFNQIGQLMDKRVTCEGNLKLVIERARHLKIISPDKFKITIEKGIYEPIYTLTVSTERGAESIANCEIGIVGFFQQGNQILPKIIEKVELLADRIKEVKKPLHSSFFSRLFRRTPLVQEGAEAYQ